MKSEQTALKLSRVLPDLEEEIHSSIQYETYNNDDTVDPLSVNGCLLFIQKNIYNVFVKENNMKDNIFHLNQACSILVCLLDQSNLIDEMIKEYKEITQNIITFQDFLVFSQNRLNKCFDIYSNTFSDEAYDYVSPLADIVFSYLYFRKDFNRETGFI